MKKIYTYNNVILVDDEDFNVFSKYNWSTMKGNKTFYAVRYIKIISDGKRQISILLHREIMKAKKTEFVDHINRNGLDNRRSNLRLCTKQQNAMNQGMRVDNTSGYKGVSFFKRTGKWTAQIHVDGIKKHLGCFSSKEEAHIAYKESAKLYYKEFACVA